MGSGQPLRRGAGGGLAPDQRLHERRGDEPRLLAHLHGARALRPPNLAADARLVVARSLGPGARSTGRPRPPDRHARRHGRGTDDGSHSRAAPARARDPGTSAARLRAADQYSRRNGVASRDRGLRPRVGSRHRLPARPDPEDRATRVDRGSRRHPAVHRHLSWRAVPLDRAAARDDFGRDPRRRDGAIRRPRRDRVRDGSPTFSATASTAPIPRAGTSTAG